jgi:hypothetical protein
LRSDLAWTDAEQTSERGRVSALTTPTCPHGQLILTIMVLLPVVDFGGTKKPPVHFPRGQVYDVRREEKPGSQTPAAPSS